jgi:hypothetical protein
MDGRGALRLSVFLLVVSAGCQHQVMTVPSPGPQSTADKPPPPTDRSQIKPASTKSKPLPPQVWVSSGDFKAGEASAPDTPPDRQQQIRELARADYEQALKLDPKCVPAYRGLARLYTAMRDIPLAVETYHKALQITPNNAPLWYELGMCHNYQKNWGSALDCLNRAMQLDPHNRSYVNAMGVVLAESGRYEESLNCFIRSNGEALGHYRLAQTLQRLQQPELSRRYLEAAVQKDPNLGTTALAARHGGKETPNQAPPPIQQTAYQAPNASPAPAAPAVTPQETPPATPAAAPQQEAAPAAPAAESQPAQQQVILPPPPAVNVQYEQPNP